MDMVDQECNQGTLPIVCTFCTTFLAELLVKVNEENNLILYGREQVIVTDEVKDIRPAEPDKVRKCFPGLSIHGITERMVSEVLRIECKYRTVQLNTP